MLGLKKARPSELLYLAYFPYIQRKTPVSDPLYANLPFDEIQTQFIASVLRWCLQRDMVKKSANGEYLIPQLDKNVASLSYLLHTYNFQYLVYEDRLVEFLGMIADNQSTQHVTALQQLTIGLLSIQDPVFIHYHINRTYTAFDAIPMPAATLTWPEIHRRYPYMWVILTLHIVLRNFTEMQ